MTRTLIQITDTEYGGVSKLVYGMPGLPLFYNLVT